VLTRLAPDAFAGLQELLASPTGNPRGIPGTEVLIVASPAGHPDVYGLLSVACDRVESSNPAPPGPDLTAAPMDPIALAAELESLERLARIVRFDRRKVVA
jgi:hypothetical protein